MTLCNKYPWTTINAPHLPCRQRKNFGIWPLYQYQWLSETQTNSSEKLWGKQVVAAMCTVNLGKLILENVVVFCRSSYHNWLGIYLLQISEMLSLRKLLITKCKLWNRIALLFLRLFSDISEIKLSSKPLFYIICKIFSDFSLKFVHIYAK